MGQRSYVDDFCNFDASAMYGADSRFAAVSGAFDVCFNFAETEVVGSFGAVLGSHLSGVGGVFLGAAEAHFAS